MLSGTISLGKRAFRIFSEERAASRGAAIAFYTVTSMAPILVIVVAIAGLAFGGGRRQRRDLPTVQRAARSGQR